ncbi:hypothetical protein LINPERHAP2_LOCUS40730, partial [Linum perenne]
MSQTCILVRQSTIQEEENHERARKIMRFCLGKFGNEVSAIRADDIATIKVREKNAFATFDIQQYDVKLDCPLLPAGKAWFIYWANLVVHRISVEDLGDY